MHIAIRWEGAQFAWHSLGHVNREFCRGLMESGVELSLVPTEPDHFSPQDDPRFRILADRCFAPLSRPADVHVRHFFPPRLDQPDEGHFVLLQPWEYGYLPQRWIQPILDRVSDVWCYSSYVRDVYRASGISEERLQVVPLGVDTEVFRPDAPPYVFTTEPGACRIRDDLADRFVFLYCGGTLHRKGIDILLDAYLKAFSAYDDVCLVIKDTGTQTVYYGQNEKDRILGLVNDESRPPIVYLDEEMTGHRLAGIYTTSNCLVQPYRGEGFCLPALEAMACGVPAIVTDGGPTDDFVDDSVGWRILADRKPYGNSRIGELDCVGQTWMFEVPVDKLIRLMRQVYRDRDEAGRRGAAAARQVREGWTWRHSCDQALVRIDELRHRTPVPDARSRPVISLPASQSVAPTSKQRRRTGHPKREWPKPPAIREMPTVSLCMIVRDEERVLDDCLRSIQPWVDEMIVVDTGSTDRTAEIAKGYGAKVFHFPWCKHFSAARNESLKHATGDWLFWMDADDTIPEECGKRLRELAFLAEDRVTGFIIQVHIPPAPREEGFGTVDHVKLFRSGLGLQFVGRIHEQILESINRIGGTLERSGLHVLHSGYDYSSEGQKKKRERDYPLLYMDLDERPDHPFPWFNLGMTAFHLKDFELAQAALEGSLILSNPWESTVRKVYAMLSGCQMERGDPQEARATVEEGLGLFPRDPELLFRAGNIHRDLGDPASAEQYYLRLLTAREEGHIDSIDVTIVGYKARHNLGLVYYDMGRLADAEAQWQAAVQERPSFVPTLVALGELYVRVRRFEDARAIVTQLAELAPPQAENIRRRLPSC